MTGGSASSQAGADLAVGAEAGADLAAVASATTFFPAGGLSRKAAGSLTGSLVYCSSASWATSPRKAAFVASLEVDRRGDAAALLGRESQPPEQDARGECHTAGALFFSHYCFLLSPCYIESLQTDGVSLTANTLQILH
jgi:hypothetical protein